MGLHRNQRGIAQMAIVVVALILAIAGGAYYMVKKNGGSDKITSSLSEEGKAAHSACLAEYDDKDFCAFASSWSMDGEYKMTFTDPEDGSITVVETDGNGNSRIVSTQNGNETYASIVIGNTSYIKNSGEDSWMKFSHDAGDTSGDTVPDLSEDLDFDPADKSDTMTLTAEGKEACGNLTCFKYKMTDAASPDESTVLLFDDKDYKLRKIVTTSSDGTVEWTIEYEVSPITEPSPIVEAPTGGEMTQEQMQQLMEAFGNQ